MYFLEADRATEVFPEIGVILHMFHGADVFLDVGVMWEEVPELLLVPGALVAGVLCCALGGGVCVRVGEAYV